MIAEHVDALKRVALFSMMTDADLERIAGAMSEKSYRAGGLIIREGEPDTRLFIIRCGEVAIIKDLGGPRERQIRTLGPHHYFGEMALIDDMTRSASVVARDAVTVLILERWNLEQEIERYPAMAMELMRTLSRRIRAIEKCMLHTTNANLPVCAYCGKVSDDGSKWISLEKYIEDRSETEFSTSLCPECSAKRFPQFYECR